MELDIWLTTIDNKEGNVLFNNALNTFCIDNKRNPTTATLWLLFLTIHFS